MELSTSIIVNSTVENLPEPTSKKTKQWFEEFKKMSLCDQKRVITELNKSQSIYIKDYMAKMESPIPLHILGKFYYKESRKEFYDIRQQHPDMPLDDVIKLVKERYWERIKKKRKVRKGKDIKLRL